MVNKFDAVAAHWDDKPERVDRARHIADAISQRVPPGGRWLDYGAGTGLLGILLSEYADDLVLVDSSQGMCRQAISNLARYNMGDKARVVNLDLATSHGTRAIGDHSVDIVVSLMALHHIDDTQGLFCALAQIIRPGGMVAISDLDTDDGSFHKNSSIQPSHHGFDRDDIKQQLLTAGFNDVSFSTPWVSQRGGHDYSLFLVTARNQ